MRYPYKRFVEYLIGIQFKSPTQIRAFFRKSQYVPPTLEDINSMRTRFLVQLTSATKERIRKKKPLAKMCQKKFHFDRLTSESIENLFYIINVVDIRRIIEVLALRDTKVSSISDAIYDKYRERIPVKVITLYLYFFWNKKHMRIADWLPYVSFISDLNERAIRLESLFLSEEYLRYKLNLENQLEPSYVYTNGMGVAFFKFQELIQAGKADAMAIAWLKISMDAANKLANLQSPSKRQRPGSTIKDQFMQKLRLKSREYDIPAIGSIKSIAEDASFVPLKKKQKLDKQQQEELEILEIPEPKNEKLVEIKDIIEDSVPAEDFD